MSDQLSRRTIEETKREHERERLIMAWVFVSLVFAFGGVFGWHMHRLWS